MSKKVNIYFLHKWPDPSDSLLHKKFGNYLSNMEDIIK
jgi:hypothetical protein